MTPRENKRLKAHEDNIHLTKWNEDLFDADKNVTETFIKHGFKIINEMNIVTTTKNIFLFNFRCDQVKNHA